MTELTIVRGEEFRTVVKNDINADDIFIEEYREAAIKLDNILSAPERILSTGVRDDIIDCYENNIIAFCGERGEGKSSAMMTFIYEVINNRLKSVLNFTDTVSHTYFASPIIIDPSLFDGVHNVLDIVLAKLFQRFRMLLNKDNQCIDVAKREKLVQKFQSVYRCVSLINDEKKMLDDEYDYEGNISKLQKLGASTNLKNELNDLIDEYLQMMERCEGNRQENSRKQLIIAIDDLDLCSKNAYKMAEQIRKYMILPNVIIIMAIKLDQLELCIEEANRTDFKQVLTTRNKDKNADNLDGEFFQMSERYVAKLIPKTRRLYLPKANSFKDIHVTIKENDGNRVVWESGENRDIVSVILDLIYEKTGMMFLKNLSNESDLIPGNMREMLSFLSLLADMNTPADKEGFLKNIFTFRRYIENSWLENNFLPSQVAPSKEMFDLNGGNLSRNIKNQIDLIVDKMDAASKQLLFYPLSRAVYDGYSGTLNYIEAAGRKICNKKDEKQLYFFKILYTVKLNLLLNQDNNEGFLDFIQGYIWGYSFANVFRGTKGIRISRERFSLRPDIGFNEIIKYIGSSVGGMLSPLDVLVDSRRFRINILAQDDERERYILAWIILGIFGNLIEESSDNGEISLLYKSSSILSNNRSIARRIQISLENYFVSLCNLDYIYEKVNLDVLDVSKEEFNKIIKVFAELNKNSISCAKCIASNADLTLAVKDYCKIKVDYKEKADSESKRSAKTVNRFFNRVTDFLKQSKVNIVSDDLKHIKYKFSDGQELDIQIDDLYGLFVAACVEDVQTRLEDQKEEQIQEFKNKISNDNKIIELKDQRLPQYFINKNAKRIKDALDKGADILNAVRASSSDSPGEFSIDDWCELYTDVLETCEMEAEANVSDEVAQRYKELAAKLDYHHKKQ